MVYRRIIIDGQEMILAVGQSGKGPPCEDTPGCCGVTYLDTESDTMYKCIADEDGCCVWEPIASDAEILRLIEGLRKDIEDLKYVPIEVTGISNDIKVAELGSTVDALTVSWSLNKDPASQTVDGISVEPEVRSKALTGLGLTAYRKFTVEATDEREASHSRDTSVSFYNGVYYGVLEDGAALTSAAILGLNPPSLQSGRGITFTVNAGATQRIAYAIPSRYGTPVINIGGFDYEWDKATIQFTNNSGYTESYDVWQSPQTGLGNTTVKVT